MWDSFNNFSWNTKQKEQKKIVLANKLYCTFGENGNPPKYCLSTKLYNSLGGNRNYEPPSENCWRSPMLRLRQHLGAIRVIWNICDLVYLLTKRVFNAEFACIFWSCFKDFPSYLTHYISYYTLPLLFVPYLYPSIKESYPRLYSMKHENRMELYS